MILIATVLLAIDDRARAGVRSALQGFSVRAADGGGRAVLAALSLTMPRPAGARGTAEMAGAVRAGAVGRLHRAQ